MNIPEIPFAARLKDHPGVYVFPDKKGPTFRPGHAIAGPFTTELSARLWILESLEAQLTEARRSVWAEVCRRLGAMSADLGLELYLVDGVIHGQTLEQLARYIPKPKVRGPERRHEPDRRELAAGSEREQT